MQPPRFLTITEHPVFGFLGSFRGLPIAATGPNFGPPFRECELGIDISRKAC